MHKKWTHSKYLEELANRNKLFTPLNEYSGANTPLLHRCEKGHEWVATPANLLHKSGCPYCSGVNKKTTSEYKEQLKLYKIEVVDEYINDKTPITHKCPNGHAWKVRPTNILSGSGCPMCSPKGIYNETFFSRHPETANSPGVLYCVVLVERSTGKRACIKIGITKGTSNRSVIERSAGFKGYEVRVQKIVKGTLEEVYHLEQYLHETWEHKKYKSPWKFGGHTELFEIDDEIIRSVPKNV